MEIKQNISLANYTSWLIGGPADFFCLPQSLSDLDVAIEFAQTQKIDIFILGGGSNTLISDEGLRGLVICLKNFQSLEILEQDKNLKIRCFAGTGKNELLKVFLKFKLAPALFLAGLPGDVGGGIVMNAGVAEQFAPREFGELVQSFEVLQWDQESKWIKKFERSEIDWTYRHSKGWQPGIITSVILSWPMEPDPQILEKVRTANRLRLSKQPLDKPSCGSVFINPEGHKAAQLIDSCGLKGYQRGDAQVSTKHANFIVNLGRATAVETLEVIQHVQNQVRQKTGISLHTEVVKLGHFPQQN